LSESRHAVPQRRNRRSRNKFHSPTQSLPLSLSHHFLAQILHPSLLCSSSLVTAVLRRRGARRSRPPGRLAGTLGIHPLLINPLLSKPSSTKKYTATERSEEPAGRHSAAWAVLQVKVRPPWAKRQDPRPGLELLERLLPRWGRASRWKMTSSTNSSPQKASRSVTRGTSMFCCC